MGEEFRGKGGEASAMLTTRPLPTRTDLSDSLLPANIALGPMMNPYRAIQGGRSWEGFGGE